jgi:hypothetical protein
VLAPRHDPFTHDVGEQCLDGTAHQRLFAHRGRKRTAEPLDATGAILHCPNFDVAAEGREHGSGGTNPRVEVAGSGSPQRLTELKADILQDRLGLVRRELPGQRIDQRTKHRCIGTGELDLRIRVQLIYGSRLSRADAAPKSFLPNDFITLERDEVSANGVIGEA